MVDWDTQYLEFFDEFVSTDAVTIGFVVGHFYAILVLKYGIIS